MDFVANLVYQTIPFPLRHSHLYGCAYQGVGILSKLATCIIKTHGSVSCGPRKKKPWAWDRQVCILEE